MIKTRILEREKLVCEYNWNSDTLILKEMFSHLYDNDDDVHLCLWLINNATNNACVMFFCDTPDIDDLRNTDVISIFIRNFDVSSSFIS